MLWSQPLGGLVALLVAVSRGESGIASDDLLWTVLAGICGPTALVCFYRGLAVGRMGVVAPIAGVLGAGIPVVVGGIIEGLPGTLQLAGIALALASVVLVTRSSDEGGGDRRGVWLAVAAGIGFGLFFVFLGRVSAGSVFVPLVVVRLVATIVAATFVVVTRGTWRLSRASYVPVIVGGDPGYGRQPLVSARGSAGAARRGGRARVAVSRRHDPARRRPSSKSGSARFRRSGSQWHCWRSCSSRPGSMARRDPLEE